MRMNNIFLYSLVGLSLNFINLGSFGVAEGLSGLMKEVKVKDLYMATRWVIKSMSLACYNMSMTIFFC